MRDQHCGLPVELARDDDLLLIAAGQPRDEGVRPRRADVVFAHQRRALSGPLRRARGTIRLHRAADCCRAA